MNETYILIWKANTAIRRIIKPEGGIVRIAVDSQFVDDLAREKPESYLSELSEIKSDLYNQIGYIVLEKGVYGIACSRMVEKGIRNTWLVLWEEEGMLVIKHYETSLSVSPVNESNGWHNVKKDGRRK